MPGTLATLAAHCAALAAGRPAQPCAAARPGPAPQALPAEPAPAWHARAALHLLDWLGNAAAGAAGLGSPAGPVLARWLQMQSPGPVPTLAGRTADATAAAAYHGALGSTLEMDDVHRSSILHPGPVVVPAVLAALPASGSGAQLLGALAAGYEAAIRVGRALGPGHYRHWHNTSTAGTFGAAAGAAVALGLDAKGIAQALALAGTRAGGLWQVRHEASLGKAWHMAGAARDGLTAAQLARAGLTGPLGVLDGPSGWFAATAAGADASCLTEARAEPWLLDVSFKPWPACRHAHPAMDALREALGAQPAEPARPESVAAITVHTYEDALRFCDRPEPHDEAQARFSIQHALAAWVRWGEPALAHYQPAALADPAVAALRARVHVYAEPGIQARYPAAYGARVQVRWLDGRTSLAELHHTYGDPARPMPPAAIEHKARGLMRAAGWGTARTDAACAACLAMPQAPDLSALHAAMQPEPPP